MNRSNKRKFLVLEWSSRGLSPYIGFPETNRPGEHLALDTKEAAVEASIREANENPGKLYGVVEVHGVSCVPVQSVYEEII